METTIKINSDVLTLNHGAENFIESLGVSSGRVHELFSYYLNTASELESKHGDDSILKLSMIYEGIIAKYNLSLGEIQVVGILLREFNVWLAERSLREERRKELEKAILN